MSDFTSVWEKVDDRFIGRNPNGTKYLEPDPESIRENMPWLVERDQWFTWTWKQDQKVPHRGDNPRRRSSWQEVESQVGFEQAVENYREHDHAGLAFGFNSEMDEVLEDFDDVIDPDSGHVDDSLETALLASDEPAFISSSGHGAHRYPVGEDAENTSRHPHEVYTTERFAAVTGHIIQSESETSHGEDLSEHINNITEEFNQSSGSGAGAGSIEFNADPVETDGDFEVPDAIEELYDGGVPDRVQALVYALTEHDPTSDDGAGWGQNTFGRYSHLLMLLADTGASMSEVAEAAASFRSPAIAAAQNGDHSTKTAKPEPHGRGVPWDLEEQVRFIVSKVQAGELTPPAASTIEDNCNIRIENSEEEVPYVKYPAARYLAQRLATGTPSTAEVRDRTHRKILQKARTGEHAVIDSPTAGGKSFKFSTIEWTARTNAPAVQFHMNTKSRDENHEDSLEAGLESRKLLGRTEACPVAAGEHDHITVDGEPASSVIDRLCEDNGLPFSLAKSYVQYKNDQGVDTLPCQEDGQCEASAQHEALPFDEAGVPAADIIHATHPFAHVLSYTMNVHVGIDEPPEFELDADMVDAVDHYLRHVPCGAEDINDLFRMGPEGLRDAVDSMGEPAQEKWYYDADAHVAAPAVARELALSLITGPDENGRIHVSATYEPPGGIEQEVSGVFDANNHEFRSVRSVPTFEYARSVIGLEADPAVEEWQRETGLDDMEASGVLGDDESRAWRREERGMVVSRIGDARRPLTQGPGRFNEEKFKAALREIMRVHGEDAEVGVISTMRALEKGHDDDADQDDQYVLEAAGDVLGYEPDHMHLGNTRSRNDLGHVDVLVVVGTIDPGDDYVLDLCAEHGYDATPARDTDTTCDDCGGIGCSACGDTGHARAHGRGFAGPDADAARRLLANISRKEVAQAAGRGARGDGDGCYVYTWTSAVPEHLVDNELPEPRMVTRTQRDVLEAAEDGTTAAEAADAADCSKRHAIDTLERARETERSRGAGPEGADLWETASGLTVNKDVWDPYTRLLTVETEADPDGSDQTQLPGSAALGRAPREQDDAAADPGDDQSSLEEHGVELVDGGGGEILGTPPRALPWTDEAE